jgi:hypothetical protein
MRGRGEAEHRRHVPDVVAWILRELRGGDQPDEIDDALEVRRPVGGEAPAQMLARDAEARCELLGADRATGVGDDAAPRLALDIAGERQPRRRLVQCRRESGGEETSADELAGGAVIDTLDDDVDELEPDASRDRRRVGRAERDEGDERRARELASERGDFPQGLRR